MTIGSNPEIPADSHIRKCPAFYIEDLEDLFDDEEAPANIIEDETNNDESVKKENQLILGHAKQKVRRMNDKLMVIQKLFSMNVS